MELVRNELGFLEVSPKPTNEELKKYYNDKYAYRKIENARAYTDDELKNKLINCQELEYFAPATSKSLIDLGCGEGFFLDFFLRKGWEVRGIDFSDEGVQKNFPELLNRLQVGNLFDEIDELILKGERFDVVTCNNVLEHVLDPIDFLKKIPKLVSPGGLLRISVPNDDSLLQRELESRAFTSKEFWKVLPDHLSYFNTETFRKTLEHCGLKVSELVCDFPIEFFLFNPDSNYNKDPSLGKNCHYSRVMIENTLSNESIDKMIEFRKGCAKSGLGRVVTAYCTF